MMILSPIAAFFYYTQDTLDMNHCQERLCCQPYQKCSSARRARTKLGVTWSIP